MRGVMVDVRLFLARGCVAGGDAVEKSFNRALASGPLRERYEL